MESILSEIEHSEGIVLAAPVNCYNVTAVFRKFLERLIAFTYWPWDSWSPTLRAKPHNKRAVLVSSGAMPGFLLPLATGAPRSLRAAARLMGATTVGSLWIGGQGGLEHPHLSRRAAARAKLLGQRLA
jgi:multimeric flavodoxin WrbA